MVIKSNFLNPRSITHKQPCQIYFFLTYLFKIHPTANENKKNVLMGQRNLQTNNKKQCDELSTKKKTLSPVVLCYTSFRPQFD